MKAKRILSAALAAAIVVSFTTVMSFAETVLTSEQVSEFESGPYMSVNDKEVSLTADGKKAVVIVYGNLGGCPKTDRMVDAMSEVEWSKNKDVKIILADSHGCSKSEVKAYSNEHPDFICCYDVKQEKILGDLWSFVYACENFNGDNVAYPIVIVKDANNNVVKYTRTYQFESGDGGIVENEPTIDEISAVVKPLLGETDNSSGSTSLGTSVTESEVSSTDTSSIAPGATGTNSSPKTNDTNTSTETPSNGNPNTGIALAIAPVIFAGAAVVVLKKRK